jgi:hypothetical protein
MLAGFEAEQKELNSAVITLLNEIDELKSKTTNLQSFMKLVERAGEITELTDEIARAFIERVEVHEAKIKEGSVRVKESQEVEIYLSYIGKFDITD